LFAAVAANTARQTPSATLGRRRLLGETSHSRPRLCGQEMLVSPTTPPCENAESAPRMSALRKTGRRLVARSKSSANTDAGRNRYLLSQLLQLATKICWSCSLQASGPERASQARRIARAGERFGRGESAVWLCHTACKCSAAQTPLASLASPRIPPGSGDCREKLTPEVASRLCVRGATWGPGGCSQTVAGQRFLAPAPGGA
jgi:hypothetical protein